MVWYIPVNWYLVSYQVCIIRRCMCMYDTSTTCHLGEARCQGGGISCRYSVVSRQFFPRFPLTGAKLLLIPGTAVGFSVLHLALLTAYQHPRPVGIFP